MIYGNPKPAWFAFLERLFPDRCREIPEAQNPDYIVLRQVAIVKRYVYLQQFAASEDPRYMHSHQWHRTFALGLRGGYVERRMAGPDKVRKAPYFYTMDASVVHHVQRPTPDHVSVFVGLWRDDDLKHYYGAPELTVFVGPGFHETPVTKRTLWDGHVKKMVKRI